MERFSQTLLTRALSTRIVLFLRGEIVSVFLAHDPDIFKRQLSGGMPDRGELAVTKLLLDWLNSFLPFIWPLQSSKPISA